MAALGNIYKGRKPEGEIMKKSIYIKLEEESLDKADKKNLEMICNMENVPKSLGIYWNLLE